MTFAAHLDILSLYAMQCLLWATLHHIYTAAKRPILQALARQTSASHLLHANKYATFWENVEVIMMIHCQETWLTINMFIQKVPSSAVIDKFISLSIIFF